MQYGERPVMTQTPTEFGAVGGATGTETAGGDDGVAPDEGGLVQVGTAGQTAARRRPASA